MFPSLCFGYIPIFLLRTSQFQLGNPRRSTAPDNFGNFPTFDSRNIAKLPTSSRCNHYTEIVPKNCNKIKVFNSLRFEMKLTLVIEK